jgi:hypothetical protein
MDNTNPASDETSAKLLTRPSGDGIEMEGKLSGGTAPAGGTEKTHLTSFHYTAEEAAGWQLVGAVL